MLWISGLAVTLSTASAGLGQAFSVHPESVAGAIWLAWLNQWLAPAFLGLIALTPLLYPTGRLPSPRWRIVLALGVVGLILDIVVAALSPFTGDMYGPEVQNPTALGPEAADLLAALTTADALISGVAYLLIVASLVVRYRRSRAWSAAAEMVRLRRGDCRLSRYWSGSRPGSTLHGSPSSPASRCCRWPSCLRSCDTASTTSTSSSGGRSSTARWQRSSPWSTAGRCWCFDRARSRGVRELPGRGRGHVARGCPVRSGSEARSGVGGPTVLSLALRQHR